MLTAFTRSSPLIPMVVTTVCTCNPTRIFFVRAPSGNTAWTWGTSVLLRTPPSGPIRWLSCFIRDTTAKYCGKSRVMMRHILFFSSSSGESSSVRITMTQSNEKLVHSNQLQRAAHCKSLIKPFPIILSEVVLMFSCKWMQLNHEMVE